jgi:hypothetical protein
MRFIDAPLLSAPLIVGMVGFAQTFPTIPETLARAGKSITHATSEPSGLAPTLDRLLIDTDLIVRGVLGQPQSRIGVAAVRPAEFVIFRIGQWTSDREA